MGLKIKSDLEQGLEGNEPYSVSRINLYKKTELVQFHLFGVRAILHLTLVAISRTNVLLDAWSAHFEVVFREGISFHAELLNVLESIVDNFGEKSTLDY